MINLEVFKNAEDAVLSLSKNLQTLINQRETQYFNLALSGGQTAQVMFKIWRDLFANKIDWNAVRFFWVDERMVCTSSNESNFGNAYRIFFEPLKIPYSQIFKIDTSLSAEEEASLYSTKLLNVFKNTYESIPQFDCTILGLGIDGHTASIFSNSNLNTNKMFIATKHPQREQMRVSMSASTILNSHEIFMLVLGKNKKCILKEVFSEVSQKSTKFPASFILQNAIEISVFTDSI